MRIDKPTRHKWVKVLYLLLNNLSWLMWKRYLSHSRAVLPLLFAHTIQETRETFWHRAASFECCACAFEGSQISCPFSHETAQNLYVIYCEGKTSVIWMSFIFLLLMIFTSHMVTCSLPGLRSTANSPYDCRSRGCELEPHSGHITLVEIDLEIISMAILPFLLIQEGQLSVIGKSMCTKYWLTT